MTTELELDFKTFLHKNALADDMFLLNILFLSLSIKMSDDSFQAASRFKQIYHYNCVLSGSTTIYGYIFVFIDAKMIEN